MRILLVAFLLTLSTAASLHAAEIQMVRVWPGWRDAESFQRISEYFTGQENPGREVILRTQPEERSGFYFLVRVTNAGEAVAGAKFVLQVIEPSTPEPKTSTFPVEIRGKKTVFELGLTGSDWPNRDVHPVAWKLELRSADGQVLASEQSFLWEKPAK